MKPRKHAHKRQPRASPKQPSTAQRYFKSRGSPPQRLHDFKQYAPTNTKSAPHLLKPACWAQVKRASGAKSVHLEDRMGKVGAPGGPPINPNPNPNNSRCTWRIGWAKSVHLEDHP
jgi:hypothetical protein